MANYKTLQDAINAGTSNMTTIFSGTRYDGGWGTIQTEIDWFKFNGAVLSSIYIAGDSYLGFNGTGTNFYVNRRDGSVWEFYKETGYISTTKFLKVRWVGHAYWNSSYNPSAADRIEWDLFFFDTGQMFLRFYKVPTRYFTNTNGINADTNVTFSTSSGTACEKTFTPSNAAEGKGWSISDGRPTITTYKTSGNVIFTLNNYAVGGDDSLHWTGDTPTGTSLKLYTKVDNGAYTEIASSGGRIQGLPSSGTCTLYIKAELATTDEYKTPKLTSITLKANDDKKIIVLSFANPNLSPAIGPITVSYDGLGGLQGIGGPSEAFTGDFTPHGLTWKGNQNEEEHIAFNMAASSVLTQITYNDTLEDEHIEMTLSAVATLTDIHDL